MSEEQLCGPTARWRMVPIWIRLSWQPKTLQARWVPGTGQYA